MKKILMIFAGAAAVFGVRGECLHSWGEGVEDWPASLASPGQTRFRCGTCGAERTEEVAAFGTETAVNGDAEILAREEAVGDAEGRLFVATWGDDATGTGAKSAPYRSIQKAVDLVRDGGEVLVMHGRYAIDATISWTGNWKKFRLASAAGDPRAVVIDAQRKAPAIRISGTTKVEVSGFTVVNGVCGESETGSMAGGITLDNKDSTGNVVSNCVVAFCESHKSAGGILFVSPNSSAGLIEETDAGVYDTLVYGCTNRYTGQFQDGGGISSQRGNENTKFERLWVVRNGTVKSSGGGLALSAGKVKDSLFAENSASVDGGLGGGVYMNTTYSSVGGYWLENCTFRGNSAGLLGGGACHGSGGPLHGEGKGLEFYGNTAKQGGGLSVRNSRMDWRDLRFEGNSSEFEGGAVIFENALPPEDTHFERAAIRGNTSERGGAGIAIMHNEPKEAYGNKLYFRNIEVSGNRSGGPGAGIYFGTLMSNFKFSCVTVARNVQVNDGKNNYNGAGIYVRDSQMAFGAPVVENVALWGNGPETPVEGQAWAEVSYPSGNWNWGAAFAGFRKCALTGAGTGAGGVEPLDGEANLLGVADMRFADAEGGDWRPLRRSPLVDAGETEEWMTPKAVMDLAGTRRVWGKAVDIGAYECRTVDGTTLLIR